ncbi:hypothetical protein ACFW2T_26305 [Streptomyces sp. NPDC058892]|uniref:hypothetical protein n=1 Tax=unclassified Streptomyces TaxID=2593676 RepID=UPI00369B2F45
MACLGDLLELFVQDPQPQVGEPVHGSLRVGGQDGRPVALQQSEPEQPLLGRFDFFPRYVEEDVEVLAQCSRIPQAVAVYALFRGG